MSDQEQPKLFGFGVRLGIFLIVESATLSAIASASVLLYVALRALRRWRARRALRRQVQNDWVNSTQFSVAIQERTDATDSSFFVYLMMAELVQAVGGLLDIQWIIDAPPRHAGSANILVKVMPSALCTAQGALKQLGDVNVALTSLAIAVQTFCVLVLRFNFPAWISKYVIGAIFLFVTLVVGVSAAVRTNNPKGPYYGPSGYWCWINDPYKTEKIVLEYLWLWLAAFIMLILYGITALVMWGFLIVGDDRVDEGRWKLRWNWGAQRRSQEQSTQIEEDEEEDEERRQAKAIAKIMLFYPAVYTFCVFPVGLVRWLDFSGTDIPSAATLFASFVFQISGFLNSILYVSTRPELIRGGDSDNGSMEETRPARRKPSGNQGKRNPLEKKSTAEMRRTFGFLPDRDEDTLSRDRRSHNDHDSLPWYRTRHSRSDSGGTVHSNHLGPAIRRNSMVQPGLAFGDAADEHSPEFDFRDQHIYPLEELGQPSHLKIQRKPVHLDPGFLPEMESDPSAQLWHRPRHLHVQLPSTRHDRQHVDDQALSSYTLDTHSVSTHDAWKDHSSEGERSGPSDRPA